jgi:hypothetical protein
MKIHNNTLFTGAILACGTLTAISADAAVIVTDNGLTAPTLGANDTGLVTPSTGNNRIGWDTETLMQTFTVPTAGTIKSIFLGYNAFDNGETITLNLTVNGNPVQTGIVLNGDNFSGTSASDGNGGPFYWMEFDLSEENISVIAGLNSFELDPTTFSPGGAASWPLAARQSTSNLYSDGALSVNGSAGSGDLFFAVTVVPEPSAALLGSLGLLALLRRRRA